MPFCLTSSWYYTMFTVLKLFEILIGKFFNPYFKWKGMKMVLNVVLTYYNRDFN